MKSSVLHVAKHSHHSSSILIFAVIIIVWIAVIYFMTILPQKKRKAKQAALRSDMKIGDEIVTIGGIKGEIASEAVEGFVDVKIAKATIIKMKVGAIANRKTK